MTQEFVTYEQALALKELGFNELCMASDYYADGKILIEYADDGITNTELDKLTDECNEDFAEIGEDHIPYNAAIPLKQQAFRWFREKYNIQGYIYSSAVRGNVEKTKQFTRYIWNINGIDMPFLSTDARDELHDTYEEAEQACLDKLIKICKNK